MRKWICAIVVLMVLSAVGQSLAYALPFGSPSATVVGALPPAYVGTDYTVDVRVLGLNNPYLVLSQSNAPNGYSTSLNPISSLSRGPIVSAYIPGSAFATAGMATFTIQGTSASGSLLVYGPYSVEVLPPPTSAALGDSQLGSIGIEAAYTRWFYDVEKSGNLLNGVNISGIASSIKSPIRDASGVTEQWPSINFSHNLPASGSTSTAVQPHRGLDIARTNGLNVWAMIGGNVTYVSGPDMILTTSADLDGNGSIDMYVQYEHIIPNGSLVAGVSSVTQATTVGTVGELNHVHVRFDNPSRFSMPQNLFWLDSPWASAPTGNDVDFLRNPSAVGAVVSVKVHGWNVGAHQYGYQTRAWHRKLGGTSYFRFTDMTKQADNITWAADISAYYSPGDVIEYYVESRRHDLLGTSDTTKTVYRPAYYKMDWDGTKWVGLAPVEYYRTTR